VAAFEPLGLVVVGGVVGVVMEAVEDSREQAALSSPPPMMPASTNDVKPGIQSLK